MRYLSILAMLLMISSVSAFADIPADDDPVGFCSVPASEACMSGDPNLIDSANSFGMFKNGNNDYSTDPWYLLVAVPENLGGAPTITSPSFTLAAPTNRGKFGNGCSGCSTAQDIYSMTA